MKSIKLFEQFVNESAQGNKITKEAIAAMKKVANVNDIFDKPEIQKAVQEYMRWFVNSPMDVKHSEEGNLELWTMPGSSLRRAAKDAVKAIGLDKWFDPKKMEFESLGDDHLYTFPPVGSKTPDTEEMSPDEFIEDYVTQAIEDSEKWLRGERPTRSNIEMSIDDFDEHYTGEFLQDVKSKNRKKIIDQIAKRMR